MQFSDLYKCACFLYVKANSKEICENILSFFFQKNADVIIFVEIQG